MGSVTLIGAGQRTDVAGIDPDEGAGSEAMLQSQMVISENKWEGGHKSARISGTINQIDFKLGWNVDEGEPYH